MSQVSETKTNIGGYEVTYMVFGWDKRLFITNPEGIQIYGHRTDGANYLETAKREIESDINFRARFDKATGVEIVVETPVQEISVEGEAQIRELHYEYDFSEVPERIIVPAEINDGVHTTYDGRRILIENLENDHLLKILPKMQYSKRKYQYVREALRRGFIVQVKATGMYSEGYAVR